MRDPPDKTASVVVPPQEFMPESLPWRLRELGLLPASACMDAFECRDESRRNRVFKVIVGKRGLLVKQAGPASSAQLVAHEGQVLGLIASEPALEGLRPYAPKLLHQDPAQEFVAIELLNPATSFLKLHLNEGAPEFPADAAAVAADILANLHQARPSLPGLEAVPGCVRPEPHNLRLSLNFGAGAEPRDLPAGAREVLAFANGLPWLRDLSDQLIRGWGRTHLIHGDVRWDNFLVADDPDDPESLRVVIIDLEFASWGDPAWDLAGYLSEYVRLWMTTQRWRTDQPPAGAWRPSRSDPDILVAYPAEAVHGSMRVFLKAYARARGLGGAELGRFRRSVLSFLPLALLRVVLESSLQSQGLTEPHRAVLAIVADSQEPMGPAAREFFQPLLEWD